MIYCTPPPLRQGPHKDCLLLTLARVLSYSTTPLLPRTTPVLPPSTTTAVPAKYLRSTPGQERGM